MTSSLIKGSFGACANEYDKYFIGELARFLSYKGGIVKICLEENCFYEFGLISKLAVL
jgi:hypothetical protein